jgi:hypothetical protein
MKNIPHRNLQLAVDVLPSHASESLLDEAQILRSQKKKQKLGQTLKKKPKTLNPKPKKKKTLQCKTLFQRSRKRIPFVILTYY